MLAVLLLAATAAPPTPPTPPTPLPPPICDVALDHVAAVVSTQKPNHQRHWISCFGEPHVADVGDDVVASVAIYPIKGTPNWTGYVGLTDLTRGLRIFDKSVTGEPEAVQAVILEARAATVAWRAKAPEREAENAKARAAFHNVVIVLDSTEAFPGAERAVLELVLNRLRNYGITIVDHVFAREKADELSKSKVVLLTAVADERPPLSTGASRWTSFSIGLRLKMLDGDIRVGEESFAIRASGINVDKAMQDLTEKHAKPHARSEVEAHADRLVIRLIDHFHLKAAKPPMP